MFGVRKERKIGGNDFLILNQQFDFDQSGPAHPARSGPVGYAGDCSKAAARPDANSRPSAMAARQAGVFSKMYSTALLAGEKSGNLSGVLDYYIAYQRVRSGD